MSTPTLENSWLTLIPADTIVKVRMVIRPGGVDPDGWLTRSRTSSALYLDTESIVVDGPFARRRVYTRIGFRGKAVSDTDAYAARGRAMIRSILESARGVRADDDSDEAQAARALESIGDLNGLEFLACVGIEADARRPAEPGRNVVRHAIGPDHPDYAQLMSADR